MALNYEQCVSGTDFDRFEVLTVVMASGLSVTFALVLHLNPEYGGGIFLRNVGKLLSHRGTS
jgi:hypothetical protein